jgi:hypothetical protein
MFLELRRFKNQSVSISGAIAAGHNKPASALETPDLIKVFEGQ